MICFGKSRHRRVGFHRYGPIGRAWMYGRRLLQITACIYCDKTRVTG